MLLSPSESLRELARYVGGKGLLEGKRIAVVHSDASAAQYADG